MAFLCIAFIKCKTSQPTTESNLPNNVFLLDSMAAANAIAKDDMEHFFDHIRTLDMEIQMGQTLTSSPDENVQAYKYFLREDVTNFTEKEAEFIWKNMKKARELCDNISPDIFPESVNLIKTNANHYGKSIYYTRENNIVIPYNVLGKNRDDDTFLETMLHEIFHIYSRTNLDKRTQLYELIGFRKASPVQLPDELDRRLLFNPDGVDIEYLIEVSDAGDTIQLMLVLHSNAPEVIPEEKGFFAYADVELFEVKKEGDTWFVQTKDGYKSTMHERFQTDFQRQIGPNTGYIWHPDEILADNFAFLALIKGNLLKMKDFEPEGRDLLRQIETVLQQ